MKIRRIAGAIASFAFIAAGSIGVAAPASAAAGSYTGKYARDTVCANDAKTIYHTLIHDSHQSGDPAVGYIDLVYSPHCRTAWAYLHSIYKHIPYEAHAGYATIHRADGVTETQWIASYSSTTKMVDDANITSYAYGNIDMYPINNYSASGHTPSY